MEYKNIAEKVPKSTMTELKMPSIGISAQGDNRMRPTQKIRMIPPPPSLLSQIFGCILFLLPHLGCVLLAYLVLLSLCYNGIVDPCSLKFSYSRRCEKDSYIHDQLLSYTEYKEDFLCIIPGVFYHVEENGWNLGIQC